MQRERVVDRVVGEYVGRGSIYKGDELLGSARYRLVMRKRIHIFDDGEEVVVSGRTTLKLWGEQPGRPLFREEGLVLRMENGGRIPFFIERDDWPRSIGEVVPLTEGASGIPELEPGRAEDDG